MTTGPLDALERDRLALAFAQIASDAGVVVMDVYNSDFETRHKEDRSPVSDADEQAEVIILEALAKLLPGVPVLAEEQAARIGVGEMADTFLLVDPVDGTREFIQRKGDFTVNIALIEAGRATAGCVFAPARKEMYFGGSRAFAGAGFLPGASMSGATLRPILTRTAPAEGMVAVMSASHLDPDTQAFVDRQKIASRRSIGSSLKFCLVAAAEADVYPRWGPTMEWDTAAGHAVLTAAGGAVLTPDGAPFLYGKADKGYLNGPFIAWGKTPG
jgi:3'(2'), 5'-bisphosphate nucleotidase